VAKFSFGRLGSRPPPPVGQGPATATAPAGPERHWRKRRGPSAGDGLGNRGAIRASSRFTDREHGGTQIVSRRPGSPREPRSEGPRVLLEHLIELLLSDSTIRGGIFNAGDENPHRHPGGQPPSLDELALAPDLLIRGCAQGEVREEGRNQAMGSPNQVSFRSGMYRCVDCGYVIAVNKGSKFPRCPVHPYPAAWHFVRTIEPQRTATPHSPY